MQLLLLLLSVMAVFVAEGRSRWREGPVVDPGVFVITHIRSCRNGAGYCILGVDCAVDLDFVSDDMGGDCNSLASAFNPPAKFTCCKENPANFEDDEDAKLEAVILEQNTVPTEKPASSTTPPTTTVVVTELVTEIHTETQVFTKVEEVTRVDEVTEVVTPPGDGETSKPSGNDVDSEVSSTTIAVEDNSPTTTLSPPADANDDDSSIVTTTPSAATSTADESSVLSTTVANSTTSTDGAGDSPG